jgi:hypothetical protein
MPFNHFSDRMDLLMMLSLHPLTCHMVPQVQINVQAVDVHVGEGIVQVNHVVKCKKPLTFWSSRKEMEEGFSWHGDEGKQVAVLHLAEPAASTANYTDGLILVRVGWFGVRDYCCR